MVSNTKINCKRYAVSIAATVAFLGGIAEFSGYSLKDIFARKEKVEQPTITQPPLNKASTTGDNSPAVITNDGAVDINYSEIKPKKDSTQKK